jgi:hypothetical protein
MTVTYAGNNAASAVINYTGSDPNHDLTDGEFWSLYNSGTHIYPFRINSSASISSVSITNGWFRGDFPLSVKRTDFYPSQNCALLFCQKPGLIKGCRFGEQFGLLTDPNLGTGVDLIRAQSGSGTLITIEDVIAFGGGDDLLECDDQLGDIHFENVFADYLFVGISATGAGSSRNITANGLRMGMRSIRGNDTATPTHAHPLKVDGYPSTNSPQFEFYDSVIAVDKPNWPETGYNRLKAAFLEMSGSGNEFIVIDGSWNSAWPALPSGWTLYEGDAGRKRWNGHKADALGYGLRHV